jgi:acetate kinase
VIVLVINCGSSSLKYRVFSMATEKLLASGLADRVGIAGGAEASLKHRPAGNSEHFVQVEMADHTVAMRHVLAALTHPEHGVIGSLDEIKAIGHRVVHGGEKFSESVRIDEEVIAAIEAFAELAPLHNPPNLMGIRACAAALPGVPQIAVFDTAFHQTMPRRAYLYGLPYEFYEDGHLRRYGFHGTSHRYVALRAERLLEEQGIPLADQKIVTCHIGNGCSMAAIKGGKSVDTTMGLTPLEGLLMGTRCGDLDPAIVPFLMETRGLERQQIDELLNKRSGLLGVSGVSSDMRDVKAAALDGNPQAQAAVELFCYRIQKYIGAYAAAMGGIDALVFTAGIGENEPMVRERTTAELGFLGLTLDLSKNEDSSLRGREVDMSEAGTPVRIFVIPTDEELMIARDTAALV